MILVIMINHLILTRSENKPKTACPQTGAIDDTVVQCQFYRLKFVLVELYLILLISIKILPFLLKAETIELEATPYLHHLFDRE